MNVNYLTQHSFWPLLQIVSSLDWLGAIEMMPWGDIPRELAAMSPEDRRVFNRWLSVNAMIGAVFMAGFITMVIMAVIGPNSVGTRDALEAQNHPTTTSGGLIQSHAKLPNKVTPAAAH